MFDIVGERLFAALRDAAERELGREHPCFAALEEAAAANAGPAVTQAAQAALGRLDARVAAALMASAHKVLREDGKAILGGWGSDRQGH